ncbi:MAG: succinate dehydrogenase, hydrophobic membrane anchor protein [Alphaproteobacteria bacterium]|nr:succinate dehydrogenase, hydrophobic membrane anchor protein [Alphaproteobacteria bacterium]
MAASKSSLRTPLGKVRGLGAAKRGTEHFIAQRLTALALIPLALWFVWAVAAHAGADYAAATAFLSHPVNAGLMLLFVLAGVWHFTLGLQTVIEDYVHADGLKIAALVLVKFAGAALAVALVIAVLKLAV